MQIGNWFGLVKLFLLLFDTIEERKPIERTPNKIGDLKMETAMERKAIWERDTALESAVEGHCSPPERKQRLQMLFINQPERFVLCATILIESHLHRRQG